MKKETDKQLTLRMSPELHERIKENAIKNKRSINAQAVWILENYIEIQDENTPVNKKT